jgi:hypothetical protein
MVPWTLFEAILGGDMEKFLAEADYTLPAADEDEDEGLDGDGVLPDYAASRHAAPDAER